MSIYEHIIIATSIGMVLVLGISTYYHIQGKSNEKTTA